MRLCVMLRRVMCVGAAVRDGDAAATLPRRPRGASDAILHTRVASSSACTPSLLFAMPRRPNILVFLIDDLDLERIPFYSRLDAGAAAQKSSQAEGYSCKHGPDGYMFDRIKDCREDAWRVAWDGLTRVEDVLVGAVRIVQYQRHRSGGLRGGRRISQVARRNWPGDIARPLGHGREVR